MTNLEGMNMKFTVIKNEDVEKCSRAVQICFENVLCGVDYIRSQEGKEDNTYLVINTDEPYADEILEILKKNGHWG